MLIKNIIDNAKPGPGILRKKLRNLDPGSCRVREVFAAEAVKLDFRLL
jgi:hypothetical protein